jgi:threonyl-tRNA synthetase
MDQQFDALYRLRHSLAHVLAEAVLEMRPTAQLAFGPPIDTGCYYDFLFDTPLTSDDFREIEKRMRRIIQEKQPFVQESKDAHSAVEYLETRGQEFKVEYCKELIERGEREIGFYTNGSFVDMCAGPHLDHTGLIPQDCFKLDSIAGAYWRGDSSRPQLSRLYCLAFSTKKELEEYIAQRKLAQERDHRKLGKELELFFLSEEIGPGLPLWMPNGTVIRDALEDFAKEMEARQGYVRVSTPHIAKESLYYTSGHLPYYKEGMWPPMDLEGESLYYLKAMNCPHHHIIYGHRPRSYKELPLRMAEYGTVYRFEASGSLAGLLRVRSICQNDAHIYCTPDQLREELIATVELTLGYYRKFRFEGVQVRYSTHDPADKEKFVDNPEAWRHSEAIVKEVIESAGVPYILGEGEAAFYGPKIDFQARTLLGREETISTTQLDFAQPISFDLHYIGADGAQHRPYVVHRAPLGSQERFAAFLIEHFGGAFPTWMAPHQVRIIPVSEVFGTYGKEIAAALREHLIRVEVDVSDNSFNKKVREAVTQKIPNIVIIGGKEAEQRTVTLRRYCTNQQITMPLDTFIDRVRTLIRARVMDNFADVEIP